MVVQLLKTFHLRKAALFTYKIEQLHYARFLIVVHSCQHAVVEKHKYDSNAKDIHMPCL